MQMMLLLLQRMKATFKSKINWTWLFEKGRKFKVNEFENKESSGNNKEPRKSSEFYFQQKAKTSYCFQLLGLNYNWW